MTDLSRSDRPATKRPSTKRTIPLTAQEDRQYAFLAHCGGVVGFLPSLIIYRLFKDRGLFTAQESKEAFTFTLPLTLVAIALNVYSWFSPPGASICALSSLLLWLYVTALSLIAGIRVNKGHPFRYPLNIRFLH